ncbi:unnamed protein product [Thelazia callipaeda]|uniref:SANT domain-containing protein n=1 Tax=Thelazia callipaeda TaxID=103827 RepID=A0A0N5D4S0_THECL|nr:unnamed protein product [Thelazia callipaeda]
MEQEELTAKENCKNLENRLRMQAEKELNEDVKHYQINVPSSSTAVSQKSATWSNEERWKILFAFQRYGRNFRAIAEVLETKSIDQIKGFYLTMQTEIDSIENSMFILLGFQMVNECMLYYEELANKCDPYRKRLV